MESEVAEANVRAMCEDLVARALEFRKTQAQLENRTDPAPAVRQSWWRFLRSPASLCPLTIPMCSYWWTGSLARHLLRSGRADGEDAGRPGHADSILRHLTFVEGTIEVIAPVTDPESGTVRVQSRLENGKTNSSGERCSLESSP